MLTSAPLAEILTSGMPAKQEGAKRLSLLPIDHFNVLGRY